MNNNVVMSEFLAAIRRSIIARNLIPMELSTGWPMLSIRNKSLCVTVPFFRSVLKPEDMTELYPLAYSVTALWPNGVITEFRNHRFDVQFSGVDFAKPAGLFRHEAIKALNKGEYIEKRNELFMYYDEMISCIFEKKDFLHEQEMRTLFNMLMEPSMKPYYQVLGRSFIDRYLDGKG